jgi:hypothetical protein
VNGVEEGRELFAPALDGSEWSAYVSLWKEPPAVLFGEEAGWAPEQAWMLWKTEIICFCCNWGPISRLPAW